MRAVSSSEVSRSAAAAAVTRVARARRRPRRRPGRAAGRPPRGRWPAPRRPGRPRPSPRRRAARWPAGRSTPRRGRSSGPRGRGRRSPASGRAPAAELRHADERAAPVPPGGVQHDVRGDGVVALAEHGGGDRQVFADHGAGREGPAGHDGGDIGDAEAEVRAASHRGNAIEVAAAPAPRRVRSPVHRAVGRDGASWDGCCPRCPLLARRPCVSVVSLARCEHSVDSPSVRPCPSR